MIYAISIGPLKDIFPYNRHWQNNIWINTITDQFELSGFRFDTNQGNWISIDETYDYITVERSVINDFTTGQNKSRKIILTNHAALIDHYFNNLKIKFLIDRNGTLNFKIFDIKTLFEKNKITAETCIELVKQQLFSNIKESISTYGADKVSYTSGLDSTTNALIAREINPSIEIIIDEKFNKKIKHNFDKVTLSGSYIRIDNESYVVKKNIRTHFYDYNKVIAGFSGDEIVLHQSDLYFQGKDLIKMDLSSSKLYDRKNSNFNKFENILQLKFSAIKNVIIPKFQLWFNESCYILDPYRDMTILKTVLSMDDRDLIYQCGTGFIQKEIISSISQEYKNLITKEKNVY